jgi:hypothetical protein
MTDPIDFRNEFYSKTLRRLIVISHLTKKKKFSQGVPKRIAIMADFLVCNALILQNFLASFGKPQQSLRINDILYNDNLSNGAIDNFEDFGKTIAFLKNLNLISLIDLDGELSVSSSWTSARTTPLIKEWEYNLDEIAPILTSRSENVLYQKILGAAK